jgi:hypothetical protein
MQKARKVGRISNQPSRYGIKIIDDIPSKLMNRNINFRLDQKRIACSGTARESKKPGCRNNIQADDLLEKSANLPQIED